MYIMHKNQRKSHPRSQAVNYINRYIIDAIINEARSLKYLELHPGRIEKKTRLVSTT